MKTILVDAWNTFVTEEGTFIEMQKMLDSFENKKIILTNANDEQLIKLGIVDMPYEVFTLKHSPDKVEPEFYKTMLVHFDLDIDDVIYFEHDENAVKSARSVGINTYHYNHEEKDLKKLQTFLKENV